MSEEIVLPRSGVRARVIETHDDGVWDIRLPHDNLLLAYSRDRQAAIEDADRYVLSLRAALLAGTEERIARVLYNDTGKDKAAPFDQIVPQFRESWRETARAVLSALTGGSNA